MVFGTRGETAWLTEQEDGEDEDNTDDFDIMTDLTPCNLVDRFSALRCACGLRQQRIVSYVASGAAVAAVSLCMAFLFFPSLWAHSAHGGSNTHRGDGLLPAQPSDVEGFAAAGDDTRHESAGRWKVQWKNGVNIRKEPSLTAQVLHVRKKGTVLVGSPEPASESEGPWLKLSKQPGFVLIHQDGLGSLLTRLPNEDGVKTEGHGHAARIEDSEKTTSHDTEKVAKHHDETTESHHSSKDDNTDSDRHKENDDKQNVVATTTPSPPAVENKVFKMTASEHTVITNSKMCHTAVPGDPCYSNVSWAMHEGIHGHSEWYPPWLNKHSTIGEFQVHIHRRDPDFCPLPCELALRRESCANYGCVGFAEDHKCQCNFECKKHGTCCGDFGTTCKLEADLPCYNNYFAGGPAQCFCHLAGNAGCPDVGCPCPQGCDGTTWQNQWSVTFKNLATAIRCPSPIALLTIPKSYFENIKSLEHRCPADKTQVLAEMLQSGFNRYQEVVTGGQSIPVKQCIHAAGATSQPWLHIHTICKDGGIDNMYQTGPVIWCGEMFNVKQAYALATEILAWSAR